MTDDPQMPVRGNGGSRPVPDPTELTDRAIARLRAEMTQYVDGQMAIRDERLSGIDEATKLRLGQVTSLHGDIMPTIERAVAARSAVVDEKFLSVNTRFAERDIRAEREARDNKVAVDAAFAAQKEAAAKQDEANAKAIDKSEKATAETIKTNLDLTSSQIAGLTKTLDEVKSAVTTIQSTKVGAGEQRAEHTENRTAIYATVGLVITVVLFAVTIVGVVMAETP